MSDTHGTHMTPAPLDAADLDGAHYDVVVVGGGLAGLAAGAAASAQGRRVLVLGHGPEGGRAATTVRDGYRFNQGAHALYLGGPGMAVLNGFGNEPTGGPPATGDARIVVDGQARTFATGAARLVGAGWMSVRSRAQFAAMMARLGTWDLDELAHRSTAWWIAEHGLRDDALAVVEALVRLTTYGHDFDAMSADVPVTQLRLGKVLYLDGGWQQLTNALSARTTVRTAKATAISHDGDDLLIEVDGGALRAGAVVVAAGNPAACRTLLATDPGWGELGPQATAACLDLGLRTPPERRFMLDADDQLYLSTHCPPADLAPEGGAVVQLMRYGARSAAQDRPALEALAARAGIGAGDIATQRFLAHMVTCSAVATPTRGGMGGRPAITATGMPGVFLAGDWVGPDGNLADASLASGAAAGRAAVDHATRAVVAG